MPPRRTHTKSRLGCTNCKRRKVKVCDCAPSATRSQFARHELSEAASLSCEVGAKANGPKCDEAYPTCFNCKRNSVPCSLSSTANSTVASPADTEQPKSHSLQPNLLPLTPGSPRENGVASPADPVTVVMTNVSEQIAPFPPHELRSKDFELMHHFCTMTADSLSIRREMRYVWRVVIPREGYRYPFVMHGILAIAAAHKAYLTPNNRKTYLALSDYHQTVGSEGFRHTLQNNNTETRSALFCFASIVVLFMLTLPTRSVTGRLEDPICSILELIRLLKGIRTTQEPVLHEIFKSEFAPILYGIWPLEETGPPNGLAPLEDSVLPLDTWDALGKLRDFFQAEIPSASLSDYLDSLARLQDTVKIIASTGAYVECGAVLAWTYGVDESILVDIEAHRPHALLILSYYVVCLSTLEKSFWYCRGWGRQLTSAIEAKVVGDPKCLELFQWPKQKMAELYHWP